MSPAQRNNQKVVVAMSGGVDSSVAAALLLEQGYDVVGCFMRLGSPDQDDAHAADSSCDDADGAGPGARAHHQGCCSLNDAADARLVAAMLDIPFYALNFRPDFDRIMAYFAREYHAGRTPNPCVRCNDWLKFGKLMDYANQVEADYVATGHYARVDRSETSPRLMRGLDTNKDQSYVLFGMQKHRLEKLLLPIGGFDKPTIRDKAQQMGLTVHDKPDSQEICFVPDNDYAGMLQRRDPQAIRPGRIVDTHGNDLGEHPGHQHYTVGQRRGLSVSLGYPIYVVDKDASRNTVTVGTADQVEATGLRASQANWLIDVPRGESVRCQVKVRSNMPVQQATVRRNAQDAFEVSFDQPIRAVTPGQAAVCYDGDVVLGGGWIDQAVI